MNIIYINLTERKDRKHNVERELKKIIINDTPLNITRYPAIKSNKYEHQAIGCTKSHIECLKYAKNNNYTEVIICEDDICITNIDLFNKQLNAFIQYNINFDVTLLAGNNYPPYTTINDTCIKITQCQTTTAYLVKSHYYDKLIENFSESLHLLTMQPNKYTEYALDKYWFKLQRMDNWYLIIPLTIIQLANYSNILKKYTNYSKDMLNIK